jgi:DNA repair ATPase RecN
VVKNRDLSALVAQLKAMAARGDVDSEQKKHVTKALEELRRFRRRHRFTQADAYACVRRVAEELLNAFHKG